MLRNKKRTKKPIRKNSKKVLIRNPQNQDAWKKDRSILYEYLAGLIFEGNPYEFSMMLNYFKIGAECDDCGENYVLCECEKCDDCKMNRCICNLDKDSTPTTVRNKTIKWIEDNLTTSDVREILFDYLPYMIRHDFKTPETVKDRLMDIIINSEKRSIKTLERLIKFLNKYDP